MMTPQTRLLRCVENWLWIATAVLLIGIYLRVFTPLGGSFPERTRGPASFVKGEYYELGEIPADESALADLLPEERAFE